MGTRSPAIANVVPLFSLACIAAGIFLLWKMFRPVQGTGIPRVVRGGPPKSE